MDLREVEKRVVAKIFQEAKRKGACGRLTGREDITGLARLFLSPRGREFCLPRAFPTLHTFETLLPFGMARHGVHINRGAITLQNPSRCAVVGSTRAEVHCADGQGHSITLMHGGRVRVRVAHGSYALIWQDDICITITENAVIIE